jgi:hypothetical protein
MLAYDIDRGIRYAEVKQQRTKKDYAEFLDKVIGEQYRNAAKVKLVQEEI